MHPMTPQPELSGQLGRYRIVRKLGAGGMGTVYLAEDTKLPRKVALKVPHPSNGSTLLERFRREAALAAGVEHPNLCPVHDLEEVDGVVFFIMPYIEGTPLSQLIEKGKPWPIAAALDLVRKIGAAVAHLHARGIVHRDLKPSIIMLRPSGEPVLMDFGLARDFTSQDARLTTPGTGIGSPSYMAPEQIGGQRDMGPAVDLYALGVILFELLTGRLPFEHPLPALYVQILQTPPPAPSSVVAGLDHRLDAICLKALRKEPEQRQKSVEELLHGLTEAMTRIAPPPRTHQHQTGESPSPRTTYPNQTDLLKTVPEITSPQESTLARETSSIEQKPSRSPRRRWALALVPVILAAVVSVWTIVANNKDQGSGKDDKPPLIEPARARAPFTTDVAKKLQVEWAAWLQRQPEEEIDLGDGVKLTVILVPPGSFRMGSPPAEKDYVRKNFGGVAGDRADEEVQHDVEITRPFYLGKYEVTQEQYHKVIVKNPSHFSASGKEKDRVRGLDTNRFPVENVSWAEAAQFCERLGKKLNRKIELPSEAQWEYACRAGTETAFHFGEILNGNEANCNAEVPYKTMEKGKRLQRPCEVGAYLPNAWGLFDMHGNLYEWCRD
jgi:serine/threonine protein kinase